MAPQYFVSLVILLLMLGGGEQREVRVAVEQWIPFVSVTEVDGKVIVKGPMAHLLRIISDKLQISFSFMRPSDGLWGAPLSNGSWSGMIGMLHRKEAEIAVGPFTVNWAREEASDFSIPLIMDSKSLMMQRPKLFNDVFGFLNPFTLYVYIAICVSLFAVTIFFNVVISEETKLQGTGSKMTIKNSFFWGIKTLLQEASTYTPKFSGGKLLVGTWLLSTFIIMKSYEGILTAMLTVPKVESPIDSVEELANQDRYSWKLEAGSSTYYYFQESKTGPRKEIFSRMNGTFHSCFKSCANIGRGEFVGICDFTTIKKCMHFDFSQNSECNIYAGKNPVLAGVLLAMAFQTNSSLTPKANIWIRRVQQAGLFDKWLRDEMVNSSQCLSPPSKDGHSSKTPTLKLENFSGSFYLLLLGMLLAVCAMLIELVMQCFNDLLHSRQ